jgi:hypothetical protein
VSGRVKDTSGAPLIGVTIQCEGKSTGTISDLDGFYKINKVRKGSILRFSYVGMADKTVVVGSDKTIDVMMEDDSQVLDQVVVIGYGSVKKSDLTGSVATVKMDKLQEIPANSVESLLQGRAAGLQVVNSSQDPGASSTVRIRGGSSLNGSNAPLVVVDGFPLGDAGDLKQITLPISLISKCLKMHRPVLYMDRVVLMVLLWLPLSVLKQELPISPYVSSSPCRSLVENSMFGATRC